MKMKNYDVKSFFIGVLTTLLILSLFGMKPYYEIDDVMSRLNDLDDIMSKLNTIEEDVSWMKLYGVECDGGSVDCN